MEIDRVLKNTAFLFVGRGLEKAAQFLVLILVGRYALLGSYGKYALALYFTALCVVLFDLGLQPFAVREVACDPSRSGSVFVNGLAVKCVYSVGFFSLLCVVVLTLNYPRVVTQCILIVLAGRAFGSFTQFNKAFFRGHGKMEYEALTAFVETCLLLGVTAWALLAGGNPIGLGFSWLVSGIGGFLVSLILLDRKIFALRQLSWFPQQSLMKGIARESLFFGLCSLFTMIYFYLDTVILSKIDAMESVAVYTAAYNLIFALLFFPQIYVDVLFPLLSNYHALKSDASVEIVRHVSRYLLLFTVPIGVGTMLLAKPIISFFYGHNLLFTIHGKGAPEALRILVWDGCLIFFTYFWGNSLAAMQRQRVVTAIGGVGAALNIALNFLLIPRFSFTGAAVATVGTEAAIFFCLLYFLADLLDFRDMTRAFLQAAVASLVMFLAMTHFPWLTSLSISIVAGVGTYFVCLLLSGAFGRRDVLVLRKLWARS